MSKEEYYKYIEENDTYPEHSHKWIVRTYTGDKLFYRNFGTFETKEEAKEFIENYKVKYTTKGFITRYSIQGVCEVVQMIDTWKKWNIYTSIHLFEYCV